MRALLSGSATARIGHIARALERADLAAQPQAVEILQAERDDHQVVIAFGGMEQRLGRIGLDLDRVLLRQHRAMRS